MKATKEITCNCGNKFFILGDGKVITAREREEVERKEREKNERIAPINKIRDEFAEITANIEKELMPFGLSGATATAIHIVHFISLIYFFVATASVLFPKANTLSHIYAFATVFWIFFISFYILYWYMEGANKKAREEAKTQILLRHSVVVQDFMNQNLDTEKIFFGSEAEMEKEMDRVMHVKKIKEMQEKFGVFLNQMKRERKKISLWKIASYALCLIAAIFIFLMPFLSDGEKENANAVILTVFFMILAILTACCTAFTETLIGELIDKFLTENSDPDYKQLRYHLTSVEIPGLFKFKFIEGSSGS